MINHVIKIGEVKSFSDPVTLVCYGLGSCVGLFMQDRAKGIAGGAHILLPEDENGPPCSEHWYSVRRALERIFEEFQMLGSSLKGLRAKITGGANVYTATGSGERIVQSVVDGLTGRNVYLAASDVGGRLPRTAHFYSDTGMMLVKTAQTNSYRIF